MDMLKILNREGLKSTLKLIMDYIKSRFNILSKDLENEGIYIDDKDIDFLSRVNMKIGVQYISFFTKNRVLCLAGTEDLSSIDTSKIKYRLDIVVGVDFSTVYNKLIYKSYEFSGDNCFIHIPKKTPFILTKLVENDYKPINISKYDVKKDVVDWSKSLLILESREGHILKYHGILHYNALKGKYPGWTSVSYNEGERFSNYVDEPYLECISLYRYLQPGYSFIIHNNTIFGNVYYNLNFRGSILKANCSVLEISITHSIIKKANIEKAVMEEVITSMFNQIIQDILKRCPTVYYLINSVRFFIYGPFQPKYNYPDMLNVSTSLEAYYKKVNISGQSYLINKEVIRVNSDPKGDSNMSILNNTSILHVTYKNFIPFYLLNPDIENKLKPEQCVDSENNKWLGITSLYDKNNFQVYLPEGSNVVLHYKLNLNEESKPLTEQIILNQNQVIFIKLISGEWETIHGSTPRICLRRDYNLSGYIEALGKGVKKDLFRGTPVIDVSNLIMESELTNNAYVGLFRDCIKLIKGPEVLPALTAKESCYAYMFINCTSLTKAPDLLATKLSMNCYNNMFNNCTSLTKAPDLLVEEVSEDIRMAYMGMFANCTSLRYIKCMLNNQDDNFTTLENITKNWVSGVPINVGKFVKKKDSKWPFGESGHPEGWDYDEVD